MNEINPLDRIQQLCDERGWSYYQLAKASGITYSTLNTMVNKQNMPSLPTLQKLCQGFGISVTDFLSRTGAKPGLRKIRRPAFPFYRLSPDEKQLALAYMKGLAKKL